MIQNLLDNAIEENCRITDLEEREIKWTILQADLGLKMQIENTCLDIDKIDFENPYVIAIPMKVVGCDGSPVRAIAVEWED